MHIFICSNVVKYPETSLFKPRKNRCFALYLSPKIRYFASFKPRKTVVFALFLSPEVFCFLYSLSPKKSLFLRYF